MHPHSLSRSLLFGLKICRDATQGKFKSDCVQLHSLIRVFLDSRGYKMFVPDGDQNDLSLH